VRKLGKQLELFPLGRARINHVLARLPEFRHGLAALSLLVAFALWTVFQTGLFRDTFLTDPDTLLRDWAQKLAVDTRPDDAPGIIHLVYDDEAMLRGASVTLPGCGDEFTTGGGLPTRVPTKAIIHMLDVARASRYAVVLDIDLVSRDQGCGADRLMEFLTAWGKDENAPLLVIALPNYKFAATRMVLYEPLDRLVTEHANIVWASTGAFAGDDGVVRSQRFWACILTSGDPPGVTAVPSAPLYVWARYVTESPTAAISVVDSAFADVPGACVGADPGTGVIHLAGNSIPARGPIIYTAATDAITAGTAARVRYARDGLPRLATIGYCAMDPGECDGFGSAGDLDSWVRDRPVFISGANMFSADVHETPVGHLTGAIILANASRGLLAFGPPILTPLVVQAGVILLYLIGIWMLWLVFNRWNQQVQIQRRETPSHRWLQRAGLRMAEMVTNPVAVKAIGLAFASLATIVYYYFIAFDSSTIEGLFVVTWGINFVIAIGELGNWARRRFAPRGLAK